ncbi:MAG: hypothetical protein HY225_01545 [Candidatus Vogelbacteria bacterium]|nr:hypothetical protein [Candidatus Vogelbacteria bacterium]
MMDPNKIKRPEASVQQKPEVKKYKSAAEEIVDSGSPLSREIEKATQDSLTGLAELNAKMATQAKIANLKEEERVKVRDALRDRVWKQTVAEVVTEEEKSQLEQLSKQLSEAEVRITDNKKQREALKTSGFGRSDPNYRVVLDLEAGTSSAMDTKLFAKRELDELNSKIAQRAEPIYAEYLGRATSEIPKEDQVDLVYTRESFPLQITYEEGKELRDIYREIANYSKRVQESRTLLSDPKSSRRTLDWQKQVLGDMATSLGVWPSKYRDLQDLMNSLQNVKRIIDERIGAGVKESEERKKFKLLEEMKKL